MSLSAIVVDVVTVPNIHFDWMIDEFVCLQCPKIDLKLKNKRDVRILLKKKTTLLPDQQFEKYCSPGVNNRKKKNIWCVKGLSSKIHPEYESV